KLSGGYTIEAKIPLQDIATKRDAVFTGLPDNLFVPADGMRIPVDFAINDNDNGKTREGILCYSPENKDKSWEDVSRWSYTWIGTKLLDVEKENSASVSSYSVSQNYPNPFNPTTNIKYSIAKSGIVSLKIFDVIGKEVAVLVNQYQTAGTYHVQFDASHLSSGIYFYKLQSGDFTSVNKMMLIK
ncbi:MAG: T9SS type A sorting domain-containing protein, partial [Ignavibacteria bacterium]